MNAISPSRRAVLIGGGALVVGFALRPSGLLAQEAASGQRPVAPDLPGSLKLVPRLDAWIRIDQGGAITVFTGKAELGQGIRTALTQVAAEELMVGFDRIGLVTADTGRTPDEGYTAGSHSMQDSGTAILNAAAQVRRLLVDAAARRLGIDAGQLRVEDGVVVAPGGRRMTYGALVADIRLDVDAQPRSDLRPAGDYALIGRAVARVDIPGKVTGAAAYVQDMRPPGMVHARVVRPPGYGAELRTLDTSAALALSGVVKIVRDGSFLAVAAKREYQAVQAMRALAKATVWSGAKPLPGDVFATLRGLPSEEHVVLDRGAHGLAADARRIEAEYRRPYQMHGAIGPSCALAQFADGILTVWSHAQGMFPLRKAIAELVRLPPEKVRCIHVEGSGCYGHNGADDAAADAAFVAMALAGPPVRVQLMREDEHLWEPYGPAMITRCSGALAPDGRIADWRYEVTSNTHSTRPGGAGDLLAGLFLAAPFRPTPPKPIPQPEGGGDRNAIPIYALPNAAVVHRFVPAMPVRVSALRSLGAYMNVFSIESFMDELARAAADPVAFRLRHLDDARAREVVTAAADRFGWAAAAPGSGRGFGFARYKNLAAFAAVAMQVRVDRETGSIEVARVAAAVDCGQAVNPDGVRNQIEGGIVQSLSWSLCEAVRLGPEGIGSSDWSGYPILRFPAVPGSIDVHVVDRPGEPYLGTGEAAQGPAAAALANAVADATGVRLRELPLTAERVRAQTDDMGKRPG